MRPASKLALNGLNEFNSTMHMNAVHAIFYNFAVENIYNNIKIKKAMGAAGNKKPKKAKTAKHAPRYEMEDSMSAGLSKGKKKCLH